VPDVGSCELKHVAQCYVTLKYCVGRCNSFVCGIGLHNKMDQNKIISQAFEVG
jgi:hypothetical protein